LIALTQSLALTLNTADYGLHFEVSEGNYTVVVWESLHLFRTIVPGDGSVDRTPNN
jgi:hypothetical protein